MCLSLMVLGMGSSIASANANQNNAQYQRDMANKAAKEQGDTAAIQASQAENARTTEFMKARSSSLAAIGASGLGDHLSFFQAMDGESQTQWLRDVANIRLNLTQTKSTLADQVRVNDYSFQVAKVNAKTAKIAAVATFAQSVEQAAAQAMGAG